MAHLSIIIVGLTLLQLCRAEISDALHESWYSANVINEGFHPKPISEIFSTEATFSRSNPIIILPKSNIYPDDIPLWSSFAPPSNEFTRNGPLFAKSIQMSTPSNILTFSKEKKVPSTADTTPQSPKPKFAAVSFQTESETTVGELMELVQEYQSTEHSNPVKLTTQTWSTSVSPETSSIPQHYMPQRIPITTAKAETSSESITETLSETTTILPSSSSIIVPSTELSSTLPTTTVSETFVSTQIPSTVFSTPSTSLTSIQQEEFSNAPPSTPIISLSKTGVTHYHSTITKKPSTNRTRKQKLKNLFNVCLESCEESTNPICAAPKSKGLIDPNTLRGFPSICHMVCYNVFKEERYEKLVDGRCGKLRTRIRPVDSKHKLKRTELNKAEYIIEDTEPKTFMEFLGLD